mgnify:CR=1 FL=1
MAAITEAEEWAQQPGVRRLLAAILADPHGDHAAGVAGQLDGVLLDAHVAGIVRVLETLGTDATFGQSFTTNGGAALHAVLYHLLGGDQRGLPQPPLNSSREEIQRCKAGWATAKPASDKFFKDLPKARWKAKEGGDASWWHDLHGRVFNPDTHKNLRAPGTPAPKQAPKHGKEAHAVAAGGGGGGGGDGGAGEAEIRRRAACGRALAMGTHPRLGMSSVVQKLAGVHDVFRLIAEHAELRTTLWIAKSPPKEVLTLRRHLHAEHAELFVTRQHLDDALVREQALARENEQLRRQLQSARCAEAEADGRAEEIREEAGAWKEQVAADCERRLKEQRCKHAREMREQDRALTNWAMAERERADATDAQRVADLEAMSGDRRELIAELAAARDGAQGSAARFEEQYTQQRAAAERLRAARNASALERQACPRPRSPICRHAVHLMCA